MKLDGRKLSRETLTEIRIRAVKQVENGEHPEDVIAALGFHRSAIFRWIAQYREGGFDGLKVKKQNGRKTKLSGEQIQKLYQLVTQNNPLQLNFEFALWSRDMIRQLIRDQFNVRLSATSVGRLLNKLGLTPQKPLYRAYQRDEEKVREWKEVAYPEIRKLAKKEGAEIYFGDEASVRSDYHRGTTWAPKGETPVIEATGGRFSVNLISAVSSSGGFRFMSVNGRMNSERFIEFLKRLQHNTAKPIFLILDGHPVHKSKRVNEYVKNTQGRLRLFILPPYSPHLNPDEWVWNWLKRHNIGRATIKGPDHLREKVRRYLMQLQKLPDLVKSFFLDKNLKYIHAET